MNTDDELKGILANNAIEWNKEESQDRAFIYVDDFLNELKSKFKLLPIQNVSVSLVQVCGWCGAEKVNKYGICPSCGGFPAPDER